MKDELKKIVIENFEPSSGNKFQSFQLTYQFFGKKLGDAPIILINHALTGNSLKRTGLEKKQKNNYLLDRLGQGDKYKIKPNFKSDRVLKNDLKHFLENSTISQII